MNKVAWSGIVLLISVVMLIVQIVNAIKTPIDWWMVIGLIIVSYGIYSWHMGFIHDYRKSKN